MKSTYLVIFSIVVGFFIVGSIWIDYSYVLSAFSKDSAIIQFIDEGHERFASMLEGWKNFANDWTNKSYLTAIKDYFKLFKDMIFDVLYFAFWFPLKFIWIFIDTIFRLIPRGSNSYQIIDVITNYSEVL